MIKWSASALLLLVTSASAAAPEPQAQPRQFAQLIIREQIVVRVPIRQREVAAASASLIHWKEGKGPKCVPARSIMGATLLSQNSVDLILRDKRRVRAKLQSRCPALDYYYGFYVTPSPDGMICADRDIIRSRMGGQCEIDAFRTLQAMRRE